MGYLTSTRMNVRLFGGLCCFVAAWVLPAILVPLGAVTIPTALRDRVHRALVMDSQAEVDEWIRKDDGWKTNNSITFVFYSTPLPAPRPCVRFLLPVHAARRRSYQRQGAADGDACAQTSVRGRQR